MTSAPRPALALLTLGRRVAPRTALPLGVAGLLLAALPLAARGQGAGAYALAWPPSRYDTAELILFRAHAGSVPLQVHVMGRGLDTVVDVPASEAVRVQLPVSARCAPGVDACVIDVARATGTDDFEAELQSPSTMGVTDTLLFTAHDTVRIPPPSHAGTRVAILSVASEAAADFPQQASFATVVPQAGGAHVTGGGGCAGALDETLAPGEALTIACTADGADASGLTLDADAPVLVLSGNVVAPVPGTPGTGYSADYVMDVSPPAPPGPVTYVAPGLPRAAAHAGQGDVVRLVAAAAASVRVRDDRGADSVVDLVAGQVLDLDTAGAGADRVLRLDCSGPVTAWHVLKSRALRGTGDPAAVALVPVERFTTFSRFFAPDGYAEGTSLAVVTTPGASITLDGAALPALSDAPGGGLAFVVVPLPDPPATTGAVHELAGSAPFGAWLLGQGGYKAHACIAAEDESIPPPPGTDVLRGVTPAALALVGRSTTRAWDDATVAAPALFFRVADDAALLRVTRSGADAQLRW